MTSRTRWIVLLVSTPLVAFVVIGGLLGRTFAKEGTYPHLRIFEDVVSLIAGNYVEEVEVDKVMSGAMRGLAEGLDPDSAYLDAAQVRALTTGDTLPEGDVGLELTRQYYLRVIAARDGSPAAKAGLTTGDFVRAIDGRPTRDMSVFEGVRLLHGKPGSTVTLTILRGNAADPHEIALADREEFDEPLVIGTRLLASLQVRHLRRPGGDDALHTVTRDLQRTRDLAIRHASRMQLEDRRPCPLIEHQISPCASERVR